MKAIAKISESTPGFIAPGAMRGVPHDPFTSKRGKIKKARGTHKINGVTVKRFTDVRTRKTTVLVDR